MLFNTFEYWFFFAAVLLIFYSLPFRLGRVFLLFASYVFYANWNPAFVALIVASTVIDYSLGRLLGSERVRHKRALIVVSLVVNLGILGFFKYYNLFASSAAALAGKPSDLFFLDIILPVGISFYTFASLSYTLDVYAGRMQPVRNFVDYALFVAFFPHLLAGPIVLARQFVVQIWEWRRPSAVTVQTGIVLILCGLVKKMVFADRFAIAADSYFGNVSGSEGWLAASSGVLAFAMQIFFDFSGYTDIARGCAKLLGFEFPLNFVRPYLATNIVQFWQRWHMSLTAWVREYVFRPMMQGGRGRARFAVSTVVTMTLVGLWHGASWQFVLWGAYYGVLLVAYRGYTHLTAGTRWRAVTTRRGFAPFAMALTMLASSFPLILFRTPSLSESMEVLRAAWNLTGPRGESVMGVMPCLLMLVAFGLAVLEERHRIIERLATARPAMQVASYALVFLVLELFSVTEERIPFIYFQF